MHKQYLVIAAWLGAVTVALGAFGAHSLKEILTPQSLNTFETAVRYQFYHLMALLFTGIIFKTYPHKLLKLAGRFFISGIIVFCGSLYLLTFFAAASISGLQWIGAITPIGGVLFILGWASLASGIARSQQQ